MDDHEDLVKQVLLNSERRPGHTSGIIRKAQNCPPSGQGRLTIFRPGLSWQLAW